MKDEEDQLIKAQILLDELIKLNSDIKHGLWIAVFLKVTATSVQYSGVSHEDFCKSLDDIKDFYKYLWDEK